MLKKRIIALLTAIVLAVAVTGASPVVADWLGLSATPPAFACPAGGTSGGGC